MLISEYAYTTKVNEKIDVYSFGVVLLELVTGREPNCGEEHSSLAEWAWKHYAEEKPIVDVLDEEIKEACHFDEMVGMFRLGVICTSQFPASRPSMKEVLQMIQRHEWYGVKRGGREFDITPLLEYDQKYITNYKCSSKMLFDSSDNSSLDSLV